MDFTTLSGDALTEALSLDFDKTDNDALTAALNERREQAKTLFALDEPTIAQVDVAEALMASIGEIEAEQSKRADAVKDAAERFAAAKEKFTVNDGVESSDDEDESEGDDEDAEDAEEAEGDGDGDGAEGDGAEGDGEGEGEGGVTTASATKAQKVTPTKATARKVASRNKRPAVKSAPKTVITAAANVQGFANGQTLDGMSEVTKALMATVKGFAPHNPRAAKAAASASGGAPVIHTHAVASFGLDFPEHLRATGTHDSEYAAAQRAIKEHKDALTASLNAISEGKHNSLPDAMSAAGWCAPSEQTYSFIADYVVDGLLTLPQVGAPRGGLMLTTGPERSSQGAALDDFGWTQTETEAEARTPKTFETIVCPEFEDHRLDAVGYGFKIPLLTQKAYPELVTDALRFADVLFAHRMNRRRITDLVALSDAVTFSGYGSSFTDSLEALSLIAVAERRRWNVGQNAIMEVKVPAFAQEVYRADMSRRNGIAKDSVSDGDIARHFADRRLAVEYVADWQEISVEDGALILPGEFNVMMYPSGTFIESLEDVVNLSAIYDAASLTVNEYTGVFFEQGYMNAKAGYGSSLVEIPVNTAGEQGALILSGAGDHHADGSF